jgi:hypothetical protein
MMTGPWRAREIVRTHLHALDHAIYRVVAAQREDEQAGAMYGLVQAWETLEDVLAEYRPAMERELEAANARWQQREAA